MATVLPVYQNGVWQEIMRWQMDKRITESAKELARELRKRATAAEGVLWQEIRNRKLLGKQFLRQHPIFFRYINKDAFFIADFYCHEHHLVIEIDGKCHDNQKEYDEFRTHNINALGITVMRFRNEEIERELSRILECLRKEVGEGIQS